MSDVMVVVLDSVVKSVIVAFALVTGFAYTTLLERKFIALIQQRIGPNRAGPLGILQPAADAVKLIFKEDIVPTGADKIIFSLAPILTTIPALIVLAVVPFGGEVNLFGYKTQLGIADINVGMLYIVAVTSIAVYGITLAGWASNNKYAMLGGLRSTAQMISYEISMGLAMLAPVMMVGSMSMGKIIDAQQNMWMIVYQPIAAVIFIVAMFAETNRAPFDLPEAEQELTAGFFSEYSGMRFGAFFMAEYIKMIAVSAICASLFLGGYRLYLPFLPAGYQNVHELLGGWAGPLILIGKIFAFLLFYVWVRATLPRMRYDHLMAFGWKFMLPLSLANVCVTAVLVAYNVFPRLAG
jgi:NADH-quinone oxidoreductase subunit H